MIRNRRSAVKKFKKTFLIFVISFVELIAFTQTVEALKKQEMNQYVSITTRTFKLYNDLNKTEEKPASVQKNQTFLVKEKYQEGMITYLALYDTKGFKGFMNEEDITAAAGPEGIEKIIRDYVILVKKVPIYQNFDWKTEEETTIDNTKIYKAKRAFYHYNGHVYLSLFDDQNQWIGYVDQNAVKNTKKKKPSETSETLNETQTSAEDTNSVKSTLPVPTLAPTTLRSSQEETVSNYFIGGVTDNRKAEGVTDTTTQGKDSFSFSPIPSLPTNQAFIETIGPEAKKIADKNDLYPSVMIGQAILESGYGQSRLAKEAHNLFGIKYTVSTDQKKYDHYEIASNEFVNGKMELLPASFRKYDSFSDSLQDNADLLKKGLSGNPAYYKGTWRKNALTYQEATKALTGKYATDPAYDKKLNKVISANQLTEYDD